LGKPFLCAGRQFALACIERSPRRQACNGDLYRAYGVTCFWYFSLKGTANGSIPQRNGFHNPFAIRLSKTKPIFCLLQAVKLESVHPCRTRYLVVVSYQGRHDCEECCLLGIDCNEETTVGLVLRVLADTTITLDGDGGFSVTVAGKHHIFKPVSVQAMW